MRVELYATHDKFYVYVPESDDLKVVNGYGMMQSVGCTGRDRCSADMDYIEPLEYEPTINEWVGRLFRINGVGELLYKNYDELDEYGVIPTSKIIQNAQEAFDYHVEPLRDSSCIFGDGGVSSPDYYQVSTEQPIQIMREIMTQDEFIGFLWGNIIKYSMRMKRKDNPVSEVKKIKQYATWLINVYDGKELEGIGNNENSEDDN